MTTEQVLRYHAEKYPLMQPTDAVKLLFQNEYGGGHMIADPQKSRAFLEAEYKDTPHDPEIPLTVPIGNGYIRVNLASLDTGRMTIQTFNDIFVESSNIVRGTFDSFREKLSLLVRLTEKGSFGFSLAELQKYLTDYENRGYPVVSHSREYRDSYRPAYRVVRESIFEKAYGLRKTT